MLTGRAAPLPLLVVASTRCFCIVLVEKPCRSYQPARSECASRARCPQPMCSDTSHPSPMTSPTTELPSPLPGTGDRCPVEADAGPRSVCTGRKPASPSFRARFPSFRCSRRTPGPSRNQLRSTENCHSERGTSEESSRPRQGFASGLDHPDNVLFGWVCRRRGVGREGGHLPGPSRFLGRWMVPGKAAVGALRAPLGMTISRQGADFVSRQGRIPCTRCRSPFPTQVVGKSRGWGARPRQFVRRASTSPALPPPISLRGSVSPRETPR
jgi:hypothetical protein